MPYEERLRRLGLPSLFYHQARGDMVEVYKFLHNVYVMPHTLLERAAEGPTRGHSLKLNKKHCHLEVRKNFFSMRVINNWNSLQEDTVKAPCLNTFKARRDRHWSKFLYVEKPIEPSLREKPLRAHSECTFNAVRLFSLVLKGLVRQKSNSIEAYGLIKAVHDTNINTDVSLC